MLPFLSDKLVDTVRPDLRYMRASVGGNIGGSGQNISELRREGSRYSTGCKEHLRQYCDCEAGNLRKNSVGVGWVSRSARFRRPHSVDLGNVGDNAKFQHDLAKAGIGICLKG